MRTSNVVTNGDADSAPNQSGRVRAIGNVQTRTQPANDAQFHTSHPQTPEALYAAAEQEQRDLGKFYKKTKAREDADKKALAAFSKKNRDSERGITNTQPRTASGYSESPSPEILDKTIEEQFIKGKSVTARAERRRWGTQKAIREESDTLENESAAEPESRSSPASALRSQIGIRNGIAAQLERKGALLSKKLTGSTRWWLVGILSTLYMWQLLFALLSLVGFGLDGLIKESFFGKAIGIFINVEKLFPAVYLGYGAWGICTILSISTFLFVSLWYQLNRVSIFSDLATTAITLLCLSLSFLPISNLFPFLLIWVIYMNTKSLFSST